MRDGHGPEDGRRLEGLKVLVVEDQALIAMDLEAVLRDFGCVVVNLVPSSPRPPGRWHPCGRSGRTRSCST